MIKFRALLKIFTSFLLIISLVLPFLSPRVLADQFSYDSIDVYNFTAWRYWSENGVNSLNLYNYDPFYSVSIPARSLQFSSSGGSFTMNFSFNNKYEPTMFCNGPSTANGHTQPSSDYTTKLYCTMKEFNFIGSGGGNDSIATTTTNSKDINFTITPHGQLQHDYTWYMPFISGSYNATRGFNRSTATWLFNNVYTYFAFWTNQYFNARDIGIYDSSGNNIFSDTEFYYRDFDTGMESNGFPSVLYIFGFKVKKSTSASIVFHDYIGRQNLRILPVFYGLENMLTEDMRAQLQLPTYGQLLYQSSLNQSRQLDTINGSVNQGNNLIQNGDSGTTSTVNTNSNTTSQFNSAKDSYVSQENSFLNDFSSRVASLPKTASIINMSAFKNSMLFVSNTFTRLISNTPFEYLLSFSLILGISLIFIGKMRR